MFEPGALIPVPCKSKHLRKCKVIRDLVELDKELQAAHVAATRNEAVTNMVFGLLEKADEEIRIALLNNEILRAKLHVHASEWLSYLGCECNELLRGTPAN